MKLRNKITKEICDAEMRENGIYIKATWSDEEKWFCYDLETLARGWEYYVEPKEPLIKDEKIRKAIRAWADANEISQAQFDRYTSGFSASDDGHNLLSMISFDGFVFMFVDGKYYTIDELCGEKEE